MKRGGHSQGFTIVELLIVIIVIALLAAISIAAYTNISQRAYDARTRSELSNMARAVTFYHTTHGGYPADVDRNVPVGIFENNESYWPPAPWPGSVYDYDRYIDSITGEEIVQISVRFCPLEESDGPCQFPNEPWAAGFTRQSGAYWCITGTCRAHPDHRDAIGHCLNCRDD